MTIKLKKVRKGPGAPKKDEKDKRVVQTYTIHPDTDKKVRKFKEYGWDHMGDMIDGCVSIVEKLKKAGELDKWRS